MGPLSCPVAGPMASQLDPSRPEYYAGLYPLTGHDAVHGGASGTRREA